MVKDDGGHVWDFLSRAANRSRFMLVWSSCHGSNSTRGSMGLENFEICEHFFQAGKTYMLAKIWKSRLKWGGGRRTHALKNDKKWKA